MGSERSVLGCLPTTPGPTKEMEGLGENKTSCAVSGKAWPGVLLQILSWCTREQGILEGTRGTSTSPSTMEKSLVPNGDRSAYTAKRRAGGGGG